MATSYGTSKADSLIGIDDADTLYGLGGGDTLYGYGGDDTLIGGADPDTLYGGEGTDTISGGSGDDTVYANATDASPANDHIDGGDGAGDFVYFDWHETSVGVTFSIADPTVMQSSGGTTLLNVERIEFQGGAGADSITGGNLNDRLGGGSGDDVMNGGGGNDFLSDSVGYNVMDGGPGSDYLSVDLRNVEQYGAQIDGGADYDTLSISGAGYPAGPIAFDYGQFSAAFGVMNVEATFVTGWLDDDLITGGALRDYIAGGPGSDTLSGGAGDDTLEGDSGADILNGGGGSDIVEGRDGKDSLTGGAGGDTFRFYFDDAGYRPDSRAGGGVRDVITDFQPGVDKIDLSPLVRITDFSQITVQEVGSGIIVYGDLNRNGFDWDDFAVQLNGVRFIGPDDFIFA